MDLPVNIAGLDARQVREMFNNFFAGDMEMDWSNGLPVLKIRRMTSHVIEEHLGVSFDEAQRIESALIAEGWIEPKQLTPTRKGMALVHHVDRPKLQRAAAEAILDKVLEWAAKTNAVADARVKVKTIHLYGSLAQGADEVGDIDLFIEFTTMDLAMDLQPEDMERENELSAELTAISEYLSLSSFIDRKMMDDVPMQKIFPRTA